MSDDDRDDARIRGILGRPQSVLVPPFDALPRRQVSGSARRSVAVSLATVLVAAAALFVGRELSAFRQQQSSPSAGVAAPSASATKKVALPQPIPQPVTRTSPAAQVAWIGSSAQDQTPGAIGIDPLGRIVARLDLAGGRPYRSADGTVMAVIADDNVTTYSALDGTKQRTYPRQPAGQLIDVAFSPDGRWIALIGSLASVQVIDLRSGLVQTTPLGYDPKAATPGMSGTFSGPIWSTLVFSPDSTRVYSIVDWGGPMRLTAFNVSPTGLVQTATAVSGQGGKQFPACGGPGLAPRVLPNGTTLIAYCHFGGNVWFIDLPSLTTIAEVQTGQTNPFELSPIFTPDGQLVYLRSSTGMRVLDLTTRALLGPVAIPRKIEDPGPFSWLLTQASAGYIASTIPVSPDGTKLYVSGSDGITVLRVPDLKPIATLAPGLSLDEVWISGNGKTVYATSLGKALYVIPESGGAPITVPLPGRSDGYFFASEHG